MYQLLFILFIIKLYTRTDIFKKLKYFSVNILLLNIENNKIHTVKTQDSFQCIVNSLNAKVAIK